MRVLYVSKASCVAAHRDKLALLGRDVELTLLAPERWGSSPYEASSGAEEPYRARLLPTWLHGHNHVHVYRGLGRVLARGAFDLVHVDEEPYSLVTSQVMSRARRLGVPALFFAWQNIDKRLPPPFGTLRGSVFRAAAGGIAGNQEAAAVLRARGYHGPLAVIPQMGVDLWRFRPDASARAAIRHRLRIGEPAFLVGFVGRLVAEKGVHDLLEAVARVTGAHALFVGDGPARGGLEWRARSYELSGRVHFCGSVPSMEVEKWLAALDCLVLPSRTTPRWKEQFGRVLIEAMACQVPVIGSDSGEIPRVIGDAGVVFREGDVHTLACELAALYTSPKLMKRLGKAGRQRAAERYSQERIATETLAFYRELVGDPARSHAVRVRAKVQTSIVGPKS